MVKGKKRTDMMKTLNQIEKPGQGTAWISKYPVHNTVYFMTKSIFFVMHKVLSCVNPQNNLLEMQGIYMTGWKDLSV